MQFHIYNTLTRTKELFVPREEGKVKIYSCGPTVYSHQHIGNMRAAFVVDLLRLVLVSLGYTVNHVMNITDVGHLTGDNEGDANTGEDRMEKGARKEGLTARDVADKYIKIYLDDLAFLGIDAGLEKGKHDIYMPRATDHIAEQIDMIQQLEKKGYTYIVDGDGVYMDTSKFKEYGVLLSDKHLAGLEEGVRIDLKGKRNPTDFALWKFNMTGKKRDMERESPWGIGFPGRHIECSAMSIKHLGKQFDIHTGGMEHIPVHHTNEIAQAECSCASHPWVSYWVHYQWLMMNGKKIAKSDGNVAFLSDMREKGYTGEDMRMFYLQAHYRSFQDFTREALEAAQKGRKNLKKKILSLVVHRERNIKLELLTGSYLHLYNTLKDSVTKEFFSIFMSKLCDDLGTVEALGYLQSFIGSVKGREIDRAEIYVVLRWIDNNIFKLSLFDYDGVNTKLLVHEERNELYHTTVKYEEGVPQDIIEKAHKRLSVKFERNYDEADALRMEIQNQGFIIEDEKLKDCCIIRRNV